jgi:hypothetical protein
MSTRPLAHPISAERIHRVDARLSRFRPPHQHKTDYDPGPRVHAIGTLYGEDIGMSEDNKRPTTVRDARVTGY